MVHSFVPYVEKLRQSPMVWQPKVQWCWWLTFVTSCYYYVIRNIFQKCRLTYKKRQFAPTILLSLIKWGRGRRRMTIRPEQYCSFMKEVEKIRELKLLAYHWSLARWNRPSHFSMSHHCTLAFECGPSHFGAVLGVYHRGLTWSCTLELYIYKV
jgi:hypothetical protein